MKFIVVFTVLVIVAAVYAAPQPGCVIRVSSNSSVDLGQIFEQILKNTSLGVIPTLIDSEPAPPPFETNLIRINATIYRDERIVLHTSMLGLYDANVDYYFRNGYPTPSCDALISLISKCVFLGPLISGCEMLESSIDSIIK